MIMHASMKMFLVFAVVVECMILFIHIAMP